jgi:hypothetical protein
MDLNLENRLETEAFRGWSKRTRTGAMEASKEKEKEKTHQNPVLRCPE